MNDIKKEHILAAVKEIETEGIRSGRHSSTYDLIHEGKPYPPKLVISIANRFATGTELDSSEFYGGPNKPAFDLLVKEGFEIVKKIEPPDFNIINEYISKLKSGEINAAQSIKLLIETNNFENNLTVLDQIFFNNKLQEINSTNYIDIIPYIKEIHKIKSGDYNDFNIWSASKTQLNKVNEGLIIRHDELNKKVGFPDNGNGLYKSFLGEKNLLAFIIGKFENESGDSKQYWLYAPGKNASKWNEYFEQNFMGLGWNEIGDLKKYNTRDEIKEALVNAYGGEGSKMNDVSANDDFLNKVNIGDIVIAKKGRGELLGYGIVTSEYYFDESRIDYKSCRKIDWKLKGNWKVDFKLVLKTFTDISKYPSKNPKYGRYYENLLGIMRQNNKINEEMKTSLNTILYGPPGTGKTYNSINKALELIGEFIEGKTREEIKTLFEEKVNEGNIVFTTFHQNMSYEDFIEGIKPITVDNQVIYKIENGIFKNLCKKASEKKTSKNFDESYSSFVEEVLTKGSIILETPTHKKKFKVIINSNETAVAIPETEKGTNMGVTKEMSKDYVVNGIIRDWKPYTTSIGEYIKNEYPVEIEDIDNSNKKFVLIIDEINRGNVSKIFGELITLIEESKRTGKPEAITATLPYSKEEFSVPANVYILGTMNTADRSVEALDTALRRRFDFVEMMPKYDLYKRNEKNYFLNGMFAFDILETINKRIEVLLGRDHLIGHSFFILGADEKIEIKVQSAFSKNIIPLLQEYFYGDYNKIGLVLGSGFVTKTKVENHKELFANSKDFNGIDYVSGDSHNYSIADFKDNVSFYKALDILMNKTNGSEADE